MIQDLIHGWKELQAASPQYEEGERYFTGDIPEWFASPRVRQEIAATGARYRFNLAKTPVNVMTDRVELSAVTVPDDAGSSELIEAVWDANDLDVQYPDLFQKMFTYGDAYLQVWPIMEADDAADDALSVVGVELIVHGPKHCRVIYDPENERRKAFVIKRWPIRDEQGDRWRVDLYYPDVIEQWESVGESNLDAAEAWRPVLSFDSADDESVLDNPYGEIPFFHYRNALPYGVPEHKAGFGCQDGLNKFLITLISNVEAQGWPQRYALVKPGRGELDSARGADQGFPGEDTSLTGEQAVKSGGPGDMETHVGVDEVGQFAAADPDVFLKPADRFVRLMAQLTATPVHYFEPSGDAPSGESLRVAEAPLVKKVQNRQTMLRGSVAETWLFVLRLTGRPVPRVDVRWAPAASATGASDWEVIEAKQRAGVPQAQTLIEAGYESEQVAAWLDAEPEALSLAGQVELMSKLSEVVDRLSAGVTAGLIPAAEASAAVSQLLRQAVPPAGTETAA